MKELIKVYLLANVETFLFVGIVSGICIASWLRKIKAIENKNKRTLLRVVIIGLYVFFCSWIFVGSNIISYAHAYNEINKGLLEEKEGYITCIEYKGKERILLFIDGECYTLVYSSTKTVKNVESDICEGDYVHINIGSRSRYVFSLKKITGVTGDGSD